MIEFDCEEVKRQLSRMSAQLPEDKVAIWIAAIGSKVVSYTAYVDNRRPYDSACGMGDEIAKAVEDCLAMAGNRNGEHSIRVKREAIEKARLELAVLESELDPLVMAIDKANAEAEQLPT